MAELRMERSVREKRAAEGGRDDTVHEGLGLSPQKLGRTGELPFRMAGDDPTLYYSRGDVYEAVRPLHLQHPLLASSLRYSGLNMGAGGVTGSRGFPFTPAQWQELQRQRMIYKYFMASIPVPNELLLPIFASPYSNLVGHGGASCLNLVRFSNGVDPEPGRCRRTDGKKWRCARDAAPGQKYCERHVHRGRPRSRKPVEHQKKKTTTTATATLAASAKDEYITKVTVAVNTSAQISRTTSVAASFSGSSPCCFSTEPNKEARYCEWVKGNGEHWDAKEPKICPRSMSITNSSVQGYDNQLNMNYADLNDPVPFFNSDLTSLEQNTINANERGTPRCFIDAWSAEKTPSVNLPVSNLSLSMSGSVNEGDQVEVGLRLSDFGYGFKSWIAPGPLGEVLQTSNVTSPQQNSSSSKGSYISSGGIINLMDRASGASKEVSPQVSPARLASSPSGVLQKILVSYSDSSCTSSPSFVIAASTPEFTVQYQ